MGQVVGGVALVAVDGPPARGDGDVGPLAGVHQDHTVLARGLLGATPEAGQGIGPRLAAQPREPLIRRALKADPGRVAVSLAQQRRGLARAAEADEQAVACVTKARGLREGQRRLVALVAGAFLWPGEARVAVRAAQARARAGGARVVALLAGIEDAVAAAGDARPEKAEAQTEEQERTAEQPREAESAEASLPHPSQGRGRGAREGVEQRSDIGEARARVERETSREDCGQGRGHRGGRGLGAEPPCR